MKKGLVSLLLLITNFGCSTGDSGNTKGPADYVFTNAKVYTVNESQPWAEAVAVRGNKIVYVGDAEGAEAYVSEGTELIAVIGQPLAQYEIIEKIGEGLNIPILPCRLVQFSTRI